MKHMIINLIKKLECRLKDNIMIINFRHNCYKILSWLGSDISENVWQRFGGKRSFLGDERKSIETLPNVLYHVFYTCGNQNYAMIKT